MIKSMTVSKEPLHCKPEIRNKVIENIIRFNYPGVEIKVIEPCKQKSNNW